MVAGKRAGSGPVMMPSLLIIIAHAPAAAQARARYQLPLAFLRRPYIPGDIADWNFHRASFLLWGEQVRGIPGMPVNKHVCRGRALTTLLALAALAWVARADSRSISCMLLTQQQALIYGDFLHHSGILG